MGLAQTVATAQARSSGAVDRVRGLLGQLGSLWGRGPGRVLSRIRGLWSNNIASTENLGALMDREDSWYMWQFGATERHCRDCANLNGQIHRASEWRAAGIRPQAPDLQCGGWRCDCRLVPMPGYQGQGEGKMDYWRG